MKTAKPNNQTKLLRISRLLTPENRAELLSRVLQAYAEGNLGPVGPVCGVAEEYPAQNLPYSDSAGDDASMLKSQRYGFSNAE
jgi:hypothetical protein